MTRAAYAEAFPAVTGRPLIKLPQTAGRSESEIFFDALALNAADLNADGEAERLLEPFSAELAAALSRPPGRPGTARARLLPGAADAVAAVAKLEGPGEKTVQTVLTGSSKPNAMLKLHAFGLDGYVDFDIGGYGNEAYPKGTLLRVARERASEKHKRDLRRGRRPYTSRTRPGTWTRPGSAGPGRSPWPAAGPPRPSCATRAPTRCCPTSPTRPAVAALSRASPIRPAKPGNRMICATTAPCGRCHACGDGTMLRAWKRAWVT